MPEALTFPASTSWWSEATTAQIEQLLADVVDINPTPPLHAAAYRENPEVIRLLTQAGAKAVDDYGQTLLHGAAGLNKNQEVIQVLV